MPRHLLHPATALFLVATFACPRLGAQTPQDKLSTRDQQRALVKPDTKRAKKLAEQAAREEAAGDVINALEDYDAASRYAPFDVTIVSKAAALRSRLVREHVDDAERLALDGDLDGATMQLATALEIDPNNSTILERMQQMSAMKSGAESTLRNEPAIGLPQLAPLKTSQSFRLQSDLKSAYEQVAQAYGIKASFDPDLPARTLHLRIPEVDFYTAMKILALETGTFWRPLNSKLVFIAADTAEKRRAFELETEQTLVLPDSVSPTEIGEVVRAIRELTGLIHVSQSSTGHSITVRGSVQRVRLANEIVHNVEHAPGEVLLELDLLEVDRGNATNLGIVPPSNTRLVTVPSNLANSLRSAPDLTALLTLVSQIFGGPIGGAAAGGIASLASSIPPFAIFGGGKSTFLLSLPTFTAQFAEGLSLVHSGRQVLLRAQDSKPATFFVGDRYPITLSLLSSSLGSGGFTANPGGTSVTIPSQTFDVGKNPGAIVSADFRNAGSQDLAVVNKTDNTLTILLNQGTGAAAQFAPPTSGIGLVSPISLGTSWTSSSPSPAIATGSINTSSTATNNDSFADLLVTDPVGNTVIVLLGNGDGTFKTPATPIPVGNQPSAIGVGTFNTKNSDSNLGFVVTNFVDNTYSVFNGNGDGTFTQVTGSPFALPGTPATEGGPVALTVSDFNADGIPDLAIVNQTTKNVTILQGNGDGTFKPFTGSPLAVGTFPVAIASGTLSGSTGPGLAIVNQQDNTITVYLGNGDGTFFTASQSPLPTGTTPSGVAIADFVQQTNGGIAVTNTDSGTVTVFVDLGSGLFANALEPTAGTNPTGIVAGFFTNSSFLDIAVTNNITDATGQVTLIISPTSIISNATLNQQPYPGSEYVDIGIKIKATPKLHDDKEVTLQLEFEIKSLSGTNINGIPIISNRSVTQTVRLKENETSLITGLLTQNESKTLSGIPGLATLPKIGYAFGNRNNTFADDDLLILVTPRRMRSPLRDSKTIYAGTGNTGGRVSPGSNVPANPRTPGEEPNPTPAPAETPAQPPAGQPAPPPASQPAPQPGQPPPGQPPQQSPPPQQQPPPTEPDTPLQQPPE